MYSNEIKQLIEFRNYLVGGDKLNEITSPAINPQLNHITYNPYDNHYAMWDNEGNNFNFKAMDYEEAIEKGLVKRLERGTHYGNNSISGYMLHDNWLYYWCCGF